MYVCLSEVSICNYGREVSIKVLGHDEREIEQY